MKFQGYVREDGQVGIRNHVLILPTSICASDTAAKIAAQVQGTTSFHQLLGCSQTPMDQACTIQTMAGFAANPNIYGTILISLGCENCQLDLVKQAIQQRTNKPLVCFIIQECGGTLKTIEQGVRAARDMVLQASKQSRSEADISALSLALECGGSDPTSGLAANPLVGALSDTLVQQGGTSVLSETTEFIGAEHILARRAISEDVAQQLYKIIAHYEDSMRQVGDDVRKRNPSPGNKAGGITTLEEKSLGCIYKAGTAPIQAIYDYAQRIHHKGLVIMDTPGNDPISMSGMAAGGTQLAVFTTGRGTPTGHPIMPVIKISANADCAKHMQDNLDFDASPLLRGEQSMEEACAKLYEQVMDIANGKLTKSEILGYQETAIARVGRYQSKNGIQSYYY